MTLNVGKEIADLKKMAVSELRQKFAEVFGEATTSRHKEFLVRRIAWRLQANAEGGLSERAPARANSEMRSLAIETIGGEDDSPASRRLADAQERIRLGEVRLTEIREETIRLRAEAVSEEEIAAALGDFDAMWSALSPREQARVLQLLIERVEYDGDGGTVSVTFRPSGIKALAEETAA